MQLVVKKIIFPVLVLILSFLLTGACPDFADHYGDKNSNQVEYSTVSEVTHFLFIGILNLNHDSDDTQSSDESDHSVALDFFIIPEHRFFEPFPPNFQNLCIEPGCTLQTINPEVIPLPPDSVS